MSTRGVVICGFCNQVHGDMKSALAHMYSYHQSVITNLCVNCGNPSAATIHVAASCTVCINEASIPMLQVPQIESHQASLGTISGVHTVALRTKELPPSGSGEETCNPLTELKDCLNSLWDGNRPFGQETPPSEVLGEVEQPLSPEIDQIRTTEVRVLETRETGPGTDIVPSLEKRDFTYKLENQAAELAMKADQQKTVADGEPSTPRFPLTTWEGEGKSVSNKDSDKGKGKKLKKKSLAITKSTGRCSFRQRGIPSPECHICSIHIPIANLWSHMRKIHNFHAIECYICGTKLLQGYAKHLMQYHPEIIDDNITVKEESEAAQ